MESNTPRSENSIQTALIKILIFAFFTIVQGIYCLAQSSNYDVISYDLNLSVAIEAQSISGSNSVLFNVLETTDSLQVNLSDNFSIQKITKENKELEFSFHDKIITIYFEDPLQKNTRENLKIHYSGKPQIAINPPWDGGFIWGKDSLNRQWVGVSCEGIGASTWWPTKNNISDKADFVKINVTIPKTKDSLKVVCNGRLRQVTHKKDSTTFQWFVGYPITNYNITLNIGVYEQFQESFISAKGESFFLDYYLLDYHKQQGKKHFKQVHTILHTFENLYGPYPFPEDGYALVETSYWGMEHQGAISYGNDFKNDVMGFDFIILHESAHEYWGNSVGINDFAELWINEAFATYTESLFFEKIYGKDKALLYLKYQQLRIKNTELLVGKMNTNYSFNTTDIYYKGAWMLHTIRTAMHNDDQFFEILKEIQKKFKYKTINTNEVIAIFNKYVTPYDIETMMTHYLTKLNYPELNYTLKTKKGEQSFQYNWSKVNKQFNLPIWVKVDNVIRSVKPKEKITGLSIEVLWLDNYLIDIKS